MAAADELTLPYCTLVRPLTRSGMFTSSDRSFSM